MPLSLLLLLQIDAKLQSQLLKNMIKLIQLVSISITICIAACKSQKDTETKDDKLIEQTKLSTIDEKPVAKEVMSQVTEEKRVQLTKMALGFMGNRKQALVDPDNTQVIEDESYYYVVWPNKNYNPKPSGPGGDIFQIKVIIDKKTNKLLMIKIPN